MAALTDFGRFLSQVKILGYDHDPGATTAIVTSPDGGTTKRYMDLSLYGGFAVYATPTAMTGAGITKVEIVASESTAMTTVTVIKDSGTVVADALGDFVLLECTAAEVAQLGEAAGLNLRYIGARITEANAADEAHVIYIGTEPKFPRAGLSASVIA